MITKYISYLRDIRNYSQNTLIGYDKDLRAFSKWAKAHLDHARWSEITRTDIDQYVHAMVATGMKPSSTNRRLSAISGLYEYFKREGYEVENPCKYESRRKVSKNLPNTINEEELRSAYENATGATKTIIGILMSTGIRLQEMLELSWEDIDFTDCSLRINGKGAKQRVVYSTREILADLALYKSHSNAMDVVRLYVVLLYGVRLYICSPPRYAKVQTIAPADTVIASPLSTFLLRVKEPYQSKLPAVSAS